MTTGWHRHLLDLFLILFGAGALGLLVGELAWALVLAMGFYIVRSLLQLRRLHHWLTHLSSHSDPPEDRGVWGSLYDALYTLQKRHFRSQDKLQTMINRVQESTNSLRDGVVMTNARGTLEWWNQAAEYLLGFRRGKDEGEIIYNLVRTPEFRQYFDNKDYSQPLEIRSPSRGYLMVELQINLFGEEDRLITVKNVTRLRQLEQMRRDFVSNVSHEMRTPLTVISGYLETLNDHADDLPPLFRKSLITMQQQAQRMEALISDLLLLSRLETSDRTTRDTECDVAQALKTIHRDAIALSGERGHRITLRIEDERWLVGEDSQLRSAFSNLVFNAVKYTPDQGTVDIHYYVNERGAHLVVTDSGIGIEAEHIPRITERFFRADPSRHNKTGGTGLGLAIVKHVLYNHDAHLTIDSTPDSGSTFACHFPPDRIVHNTAAEVQPWRPLPGQR
ncbi:MAG: two-component system sensor histidine kinase PhoR [Halomonadaceae bacterium]|nr:MAG: two-component system sensor histidine kinase PhoR [Halomonadaceae bacterium]